MPCIVVTPPSGRPSAQRMNKSGSASPTSSSPTLLTGWAADAGFPNTNIVSNQLVVDRGGSITVTSSMVISSNSFTATVTGYIYQNGSQIKTASATSGTINLNIATPFAVSAGDTIDMRVAVSFNSGVVLAATTTFLEFDPA